MGVFDEKDVRYFTAKVESLTITFFLAQVSEASPGCRSSDIKVAAVENKRRCLLRTSARHVCSDLRLLLL